MTSSLWQLGGSDDVSRFRFVHASDLHLDTPFIGVGRLDAEVSSALRDASLDAWDALVDDGVARALDRLLMA
jgi:exonuclease SbcD